MTTCPAPGVWLQLVDGQLTEDRALRLRDHARGCSVCRPRLGAGEALVRRVAVPVTLPAAPADARSRLMARIADRAPTPLLRARFGLAWLAVPAAALAAVFALIPRVHSHPDAIASAFTARGGATPSLARDVGVRFYAAGATPRRLGDGASLNPETPIAAAYVNLTSAPAYLLAVVIDHVGKVQWLQPGPEAGEPITLQPHPQETPLRETVVLDEPAPGSLRLLTIVSAEPIPPVLIRGRNTATLTLQTLSRELPTAQVTELHLTLDPQGTP